MQGGGWTDEVVKKWSPFLTAYDWQLDSFIARGLRLLFIDPANFHLLPYLKEEKGVSITVLSRSMQVSKYCTEFAINFIMGDVMSAMPAMANKEFDLVILDDKLLCSNQPKLTLTYCMRAASYALIGVKNGATLQDRLRFLFNGSFFYKNDDNWYNVKDIYRCSMGEFMQMCYDSGFNIDRGCYYDKSGKLCNIYDIRKIPSLFAEKFFFTLSENSVGNMISSDV
jgi:hypothetical protein